MIFKLVDALEGGINFFLVLDFLIVKIVKKIYLLEICICSQNQLGHIFRLIGK